MHVIFSTHQASVACAGMLTCACKTVSIKWRGLNSMVKWNLKEDQKVSRSESNFHYSKNIICCKWYNSKPNLLLTTNAYGMCVVSNMMKRMKSSEIKTPVSCPNIKLYNNDMGGVDIMDEKTAAYKLDHKSNYCFNFKMFLIS